MGWSEWKDFGGESGGATIVNLGTITGSISVTKSFDIASITDKYAELTGSNFFVELTTMNIESIDSVRLGTFTKEYNANSGILTVRFALSGFSSYEYAKIALRACMVY